MKLNDIFYMVGRRKYSLWKNVNSRELRKIWMSVKDGRESKTMKEHKEQKHINRKGIVRVCVARKKKELSQAPIQM